LYDQIQEIWPQLAMVRTNGDANAALMEPRAPIIQDAVLVPVNQLRSADSPRFTGLDPHHARTLADADAELPPILVHRPTMRVIDGMHRLNATVMRGDETICVNFFDGEESDAFLLAVKSNVTHGLPLKIEERRAAAARIVQSHPHLSDRSIALAAGLAAKTVAAIRQASGDYVAVPARIGRDGRVRPVDAADGRRIAGQMFASQPGSSLRKIAREAGISVGTARDVRNRIRRGEDPVPRHRERGSAQTTSMTSAGTAPRRVADPIDHRQILRQLYHDPSLRYTNAGRSLLSWLNQRAIGATDGEKILATIPPHCAIVVARIARGSALAWTDLADALDQLVRDCDD
jgi:hypothetical protein